MISIGTFRIAVELILSPKGIRHYQEAKLNLRTEPSRTQLWVAPRKYSVDLNEHQHILAPRSFRGSMADYIMSRG